MPAGASRPSRLPVVSSCASSGSSSLPVRYVSLPPTPIDLSVFAVRRRAAMAAVFVCFCVRLFVCCCVCLFSVCVCLFAGLPARVAAVVSCCFDVAFRSHLPPCMLRGNSQRTVAAVMRSERMVRTVDCRHSAPLICSRCPCAALCGAHSCISTSARGALTRIINATHER